jgi:glycosyltransferase involved in cell wall biosynthesis
VDFPLVVVGDTHYPSAYIARIKREADPDRVQFPGAIYDRPRLRELLAHAAVYLHGHSVGGTNPILLDAMACSACIAYLDVPFNREVVGDAGRGFPVDPDVAASVMRQLLDDPEAAEAARHAARARQAERYTWDAAADAYERLCLSLLETGSAPPGDGDA